MPSRFVRLVLPLLALAPWPGARAQGAPGASPYAQAQSAPNPPLPPGPASAPASLEELRQRLGGVLAAYGVREAALTLVSRGELLWAGGFGADATATAGPDSPARLGAASELVLSLAALRLAERKVISLDERLLALAPDAPVKNPYEQKSPLRLAHLLEHTAGLEELMPREETWAPLGAELEPLPELAKGSPRTARWAPGSRYSPSGAEATLAALALEQATGKPYAPLAATEVLGPLGMFSSGWELDDAAQVRLLENVRGHARGDHRPVHWPARGLASTARDLGHLLRMLVGRGTLDGKQFLTEESVGRLERGHTLPGAARLAGPGMGCASLQFEGFAGFAQRGGTDGSRVEVAWFPRERVGYALLLGEGFALEARDQAAVLVRRYLLAGLARPDPAPRVELPAAELEAKAGFWAPVSTANRLTGALTRLLGNAEVAAVPGALTLSISFGRALALVPTGEGTFRAADQPLPSVSFRTREGGVQELTSPWGTFEKRAPASALGMRLRGLLVLFTLLGMASALAFGLVWVPRALFGALREAPDLRLRTLPLLAALAAAELWLLITWSEQPLGRYNLTSVLAWLLPLVWAALSLAGLLAALRGVPQLGGRTRRLVWAHAFLVSVLQVGMAGWLAWNGLLGARLWVL